MSGRFCNIPLAVGKLPLIGKVTDPQPSLDNDQRTRSSRSALMTLVLRRTYKVRSTPEQIAMGTFGLPVCPIVVTFTHRITFRD